MSFVLTYIYAFSLIPSIAFAIGAYVFCYKGHTKALSLHRRIRSSVKRHFLHHLLGWGVVFSMLWYFAVSVLAMTQGPDRIQLIFAMPALFGVGEVFGLFMWKLELRRVTHPRQLQKIKDRNNAVRAARFPPPSPAPTPNATPPES